MCVRKLVYRSLLSAAAIAVAASSLLGIRHARADGGDIEITAALVNAGRGREDAAYEWVLLTNLGATAVELNGWTLADNSSSDPLAEHALQAGASLLIAASCSALIEAPASDSDHVLTDSAIGGGLANRGDLLELRNAAGALIDAVSWGNVHVHGERPAPEQGAPLHFGDAPIPQPRPGGNPVRLTLDAGGIDAEGGIGVIEVANACEWEQPLAGWSLQHGATLLDLSDLTIPANDAAAIRIDAPIANAPIELRAPDGRISDTVAWAADAQPAAEPTTEQSAAPSAAEPAPLPPAANLRITEFMPRPLPDQPEWVELINDGPDALDLTGWQIGDARSSRELWGIIEPGQRIVFASAQMPDTDGEMRLLDGAIGNGLNNDGDTLRLIAPDGTVRATIEYGGPDLPTPAAGSSLALTPRVWVVNQTPSPGGAAVAPALQAADIVAEPVERSPAPPVLVGELQSDGGINPWMVVSAGLGGLLIALLLRRWIPNQRDEQEQPPPPAEPPPYPEMLDYSAVAEDPPPYDAGPTTQQPHPWNEDEE